MSRRTVKVFLLLLLGGGGLACAFLFTVGQNETGRFYAYAGYGEAIQYYCGQFGRFPQSLTQLESAYNGYERSKVYLPPDGYPRPVFRPIKSNPGGMYLVIVEPEISYYSTHLKRFVLYASRDGSLTRTEFVWRWKVKDFIRGDDAAIFAKPSDFFIRSPGVGFIQFNPAFYFLI